MCGIVGYVAKQSAALRERLPSALRLLDHRGPDDFGTEMFQSACWEAGLGATRLAIVDLSAAGHMPMKVPDGSCGIVFNGEVYNTTVLRERLVARGKRFRSKTDTEVVLHGLTVDGPAFLDEIDGMYALAFWDGREDGNLLLARDRFGEKPLFITELPSGDIVFGSELRPVLHLLGQTPEIDIFALQHIVQWGYPPSNQSVFRGIQKLRPGHWRQYGSTRASGRLGELSSTPQIDEVRTVREASKMVWGALEQSVQERMIADVPVGVFLSGGIDSAAVAAIAARALPGGTRLNTYTVGYPGSEFSELDGAQRVAAHLGTRHHPIPLGESHLRAMPFIAAALGEPVGDPAALPTYFLSVAARSSSIVLLTGEGSDEVLFGYPRYVLHDVADSIARGNRLSQLFAHLPVRQFAKLRDAGLSVAEREQRWKGRGTDLFGFGPTPVRDGDSAFAPMANGSPEEAARYARRDDVRRWMPESVLARVDRMTMAASIEARAPFLANGVVRLGANLRDSTLRRFPYGKIALRTALSSVYGIPKAWGMKRPFAVPIIDWLSGPLVEIRDDTFFRGRLAQRGWFGAAALQGVGEAVLARDQSYAHLAWTLVVVELWARAYLDAEWPESPAPPMSSLSLR
ncbi:MAG: asparagine synthase (glutamine-hydrolyzing) [Candidatus Eremiobacteraeota bacterium]|nr:asparagine synthase (glutamine-hydrolyzing) [Candidatus Eremiobacteraeota bacterium]MBC5801673.1 asparagine synthase (glutamine-hydrolyzing) [Candidatus Eremiobacteraeota bacterium]